MSIYFVIKLIHFFSAASIIGYLLYDVLALSMLKKIDFKDGNLYSYIKSIILNRSGPLFFVLFLSSLISGGILSSFYLQASDFTSLEAFKEAMRMDAFRLIIIKISIIIIIISATLITLLVMFLRKKSNPLKGIYHHIAIALVLLASFIGKLIADFY